MAAKPKPTKRKKAEQLTVGTPPVPHVVETKVKPSAWERVKAFFSGKVSS